MVINFWSTTIFVAELDDDRNVDLTGWVTLTNTSGASYNNAELHRLAGQIRPPTTA